MAQKNDSANGKKVLLRVGAIALLVLAVAGAVYLRQGTLSQPGAASEAPADLPAAGVAEPGTSLSQPELPTVVEVSVDPLADPATEEPVDEPAQEVTEPAADEPLPVPEGPVAVPEPPKPLPKLIDLGADKCIPCKQMAPILEELRVQYADVFEVVFIDVWKNPSEADRYGIRIIPTQIFYGANGKELFRHTGFYSKEQILSKWKQLGVDVGGR
ncbi:MAG: thioredoxin domain-containing protein [Candidatus Bipolaricaulota bacterium]